MKTDYSELRGTEVTVIHQNQIFHGFVAGADYHTGVTIASLDNPNDYLYCINRANVINQGSDKNHYRRKFHYLINAIREGVLDLKVYFRDTKKFSNDKGLGTTCPFK